MLRRCIICGKGILTGRVIVRKGMAKSKGGTGSKVTRTTARSFLPNLQHIRILLNNRPQQAYVCTKCIKKGRITKA